MGRNYTCNIPLMLKPQKMMMWCDVQVIGKNYSRARQKENFLYICSNFLKCTTTERQAIFKQGSLTRFIQFKLTLSGEASSEIMIQIERIFDGNARRVPHLLKLRQWFQLANADHQILVVKTFNRKICHFLIH